MNRKLTRVVIGGGKPITNSPIRVELYIPPNAAEKASPFSSLRIRQVKKQMAS